jgi:hypothetical protein
MKSEQQTSLVPMMTAEEVLPLFPAWRNIRALYRAAQRGQFPGARRIGRCWYFPRGVVEAIASGQPIPTRDEIRLAH